MDEAYYCLGVTPDGKSLHYTLAAQDDNAGDWIHAPECEVAIASDAFSFLLRAHANQLDKCGQPYALHPYRVAKSVLRAGGGLWTIIAALLHDVVEDSGIWLAEIRYNFGDKVADAVDALTHRKGESNNDYYRRILQNEIALRVKFHDIADNMDERRLSMLPAEMATRLLSKYEHALDFLHSEDQPKYLRGLAKNVGTLDEVAFNADAHV